MELFSYLLSPYCPFFFYLNCLFQLALHLYIYIINNYLIRQHVLPLLHPP